MDVISTRDKHDRMPALDAVLKGIAQDGGLFVPLEFPKIDLDKMTKFAAKGYCDIAAEVLSYFLDINKGELEELVRDGYAGFDAQEIVPISALDSAYLMELWHGPTLAFKDMALQLLPRFIVKAMQKQSEIKKIMVLTATSGDTGKAAMDGFRDVADTAIVVFYPSEGVSEMQKVQMVTQEGKNVCACAVYGNFDDAQTGVKALFADRAFNDEMRRAGYHLSSANSINFGRLAPQIVYYIYAYAKLVLEKKIKCGSEINVVVPTGNFGNILAAYYAKQMGLPIRKLICASNSNNVLTDFFDSGEYSANRTFYKTMSPSMDILISSNLERLLFEVCGRDQEVVSDWMASLKTTGTYQVPDAVLQVLKKDFYAGYCDDERTSETIKMVFDEYGYLMDTHTAVAYTVYRDFVKQMGEDIPAVIASTASPFKFVPDVLHSLTGEPADGEVFQNARKLAAIAQCELPKRIAELRIKPVLHTGETKKNELGDIVLRFVEGLNGK